MHDRSLAAFAPEHFGHPHAPRASGSIPSWYASARAVRCENHGPDFVEGSLPSIPPLLKTSRDGFYNADYDSYAFARYLMLYLQEQGKLRDFYQKFLADKKDLTGQAAMEDVLGEKLDTFEPKWRKWALDLQGDNR